MGPLERDGEAGQIGNEGRAGSVAHDSGDGPHQGGQEEGRGQPSRSTLKSHRNARDRSAGMSNRLLGHF